MPSIIDESISSEKRPVDIDCLNKLIELLKKTKKVDWGGGNVIGKTEDGRDIKQWPYPIYPKGFYNSLYGLLEIDKNYIVNYEKLGECIDYDSLSIEELRTVITHYVRGERFCDGLIARTIEDGTLLKVLERIKKLCI